MNYKDIYTKAINAKYKKSFGYDNKLHLVMRFKFWSSR